MKSRQECYDIICGLNDEAHAYAYDSWTLADDLYEEGLDEEAEDQRCLASEIQNEFFIELYDQLDEPTKQAIMHYREIDENFRTDFDCWYGCEE